MNSKLPWKSLIFPWLSPAYPCCCLVAQLCPTLCDLMDSSHQASLSVELEWAAISFPRGSSQPRDWAHNVSCIGRQVLYCWATKGGPCIHEVYILKLLFVFFLLSVFYYWGLSWGLRGQREIIFPLLLRLSFRGASPGILMASLGVSAPEVPEVGKGAQFNFLPHQSWGALTGWVFWVGERKAHGKGVESKFSKSTIFWAPAMYLAQCYMWSNQDAIKFKSFSGLQRHARTDGRQMCERTLGVGCRSCVHAGTAATQGSPCGLLPVPAISMASAAESVCWALRTLCPRGPCEAEARECCDLGVLSQGLDPGSPQFSITGWMGTTDRASPQT